MRAKIQSVLDLKCSLIALLEAYVEQADYDVNKMWNRGRRDLRDTTEIHGHASLYPAVHTLLEKVLGSDTTDLEEEMVSHVTGELFT